MPTKKDNTQQQPKEPKKRKASSTSFVKGHEKKGGRKAGTPNKISKDARTILGDTLKNRLENIGEVLDKIKDPSKYVDAVSKLLPFYMPKYQATTLNADTARNTTVEEHMRQLDAQYKSLEVQINLKSLQIIDNDEDEDEQ